MTSNSVYAEQRYREVPPRGIRGRLGRPWPCGVTKGGWLCGHGDECRAADILLEDYVGPPHHVAYISEKHVVESTHTETKLFTCREDRKIPMFTIPHPQGLERYDGKYRRNDPR